MLHMDEIWSLGKFFSSTSIINELTSVLPHIMYLKEESGCKSRPHSLRNLSSVSGVLSLSVNMAVVAFCLVVSLWIIFPPLAVSLSRKVSVPAIRHCAKTKSRCCVCKYDIQRSRLLATNLMNQLCYRAPPGSSKHIIYACALEAARSPNSWRPSLDIGKKSLGRMSVCVCECVCIYRFQSHTKHIHLKKRYLKKQIGHWDGELRRRVCDSSMLS